MMRTQILRLESVTLKQNNITYLNNLSLWMKSGEILGVISTSQQGLKQLMLLLVDNLPIESGKVFFEGTLVNDYCQISRRNNPVCIIDYKLRLVPDLTVTDNVFILQERFKKS